MLYLNDIKIAPPSIVPEMPDSFYALLNDELTYPREVRNNTQITTAGLM